MKRIRVIKASKAIAHIFGGIVAIWLSVSDVGCLGQDKMSKLQDAASDYNMATRFGRMDVASELVAPSELEAFAYRHSGWGGAIRVSDLEYGGIHIVDDDTAVVLVTVGWQRPNESILRVTQLSQKWVFGSGGWKLKSETRYSGDVGLIGEQTNDTQP